MRQKRRWAASLMAGLLPVASAAQPVTATRFPGTAVIGSETRQVEMHISCAVVRGKINNLTLELDIPDAERLQRIFDVNPFDGPSGIGGRMHLIATGSGRAQVDLGANGSFGNNGLPATAFTFGAGASPGLAGPMQKVQALVAVLSDGPAKFTWQVENPKGGPPINATADISEADAARIRAAAGPCKRR